MRQLAPTPPTTAMVGARRWSVVLVACIGGCWNQGVASGISEIDPVCDQLLELTLADNDTQWPKGDRKDSDPRYVKAVCRATAEKVSKGSARYKFKLRNAHVVLCEWLWRHQPEHTDLGHALMERAVDELGLFQSKWQWAEAYHEGIALQGAPFFPRAVARARWPELAEAIDDLEALVVTVLAIEYDEAAENPASSKEHPEGLHMQGMWTIMRMVSRSAPPWTCSAEIFPRTCEVLKAFDDKIRKADRGVIEEARFATLHPGTKVARHTATSNQRLKVHCGIHNPDNVELHIANLTLTWKRGQCILIDDSFEHDLESSAEQMHRTILELKIEHPDLRRSGFEIDQESGKRKLLTVGGAEL